MKRTEQGWSAAKWRSRIKVESLRKRLQDHALNKLDPPMDHSQIKAAIFLIEQAVGRAPQPIVGDASNPLVVKVINYAGKANV